MANDSFTCDTLSPEHGYDKTIGSRGGTSSSQDHSSHFHEDALYVSLLWTNPTTCLGAHLITCTEAKKWVETRMNLCTQSWGQNSIAETRNLKQLSTPYSGPCGVQSILGMENWILKKSKQKTSSTSVLAMKIKHQICEIHSRTPTPYCQ